MNSIAPGYRGAECPLRRGPRVRDGGPRIVGADAADDGRSRCRGPARRS